MHNNRHKKLKNIIISFSKILYFHDNEYLANPDQNWSKNDLSI